MLSVYASDGCQISNDPPVGISVTLMNLCNVTKFLCVTKDSETETLTRVDVAYDYEVYYNPAADIDRVLPYLEEVVLEHLATAMGVDDCSRKGRRDLQEGVAGISLEPRDVIKIAVWG